ncbi:MAG: NUDIX hydrolase [Actinomycetota bacterium]|nr:NUDIX hydrolase [Actinomycetota bacterium]
MDRPDGMSWRTVGAEYLFSNPWCAFRVDEVELPDGARIGYGVLESGGFAAVVPVTGDGRVVLVRQWRQPVGGFTLELPGGGVEAGEDPRETVRRELREEAGYEARDLVHMFSLHTSPGRSTEVCHLFRCRAEKLPQGPEPEPTEFVSTVEMPLSEAREEASRGAITAATTVLGLMLADGTR